MAWQSRPLLPHPSGNRCRKFGADDIPGHDTASTYLPADFAIWQIGADQSAHGTLSWDSGQPHLDLFIDVPAGGPGRLRDLSHPILDANRPPLQAGMSVHTAEFGLITLDQCCRTTVN